MANQWFRLYSEFATDPKIQRMSEADQRRFVMLLCIRCGNGDVSIQDEDVAFQLRITMEEWMNTKSAFLQKGFLDKNNKIMNWDKRQFLSDSSNDRVKKYRENRKALGLTCNGYTKHSVTVTERDGNSCIYCGQKENLCIDHILPINLGGNDDIENLGTACKRCNSGKSGRTPEQANYGFFNKKTEKIWRDWIVSRRVTVTVTAPDTDTDTDTDKNPCKPPLQEFEIEPASARGLNLIEQPIFDFWKAELGHPDAVMDQPLAKKIREAVSLNGSVKCKEAIQGCKLDPWCNGTDPKSNGVIHDGLGMILKNAESVERYASIFKNRDKIKVQPQKIAEDIAAKEKIKWQKDQQEKKKEAEKEAIRVATEKRWREDYPNEFLFESEQLNFTQKIERRIKAHANCAEHDKQSTSQQVVSPLPAKEKPERVNREKQEDEERRASLNAMRREERMLEEKYPDIFDFQKSGLRYFDALKKARRMFRDSQKI